MVSSHLYRTHGPSSKCYRFSHLVNIRTTRSDKPERLVTKILMVMCINTDKHTQTKAQLTSKANHHIVTDLLKCLIAVRDKKHYVLLFRQDHSKIVMHM